MLTLAKVQHISSTHAALASCTPGRGGVRGRGDGASVARRSGAAPRQPPPVARLLAPQVRCLAGGRSRVGACWRAQPGGSSVQAEAALLQTDPSPPPAPASSRQPVLASSVSSHANPCWQSTHPTTGARCLGGSVLLRWRRHTMRPLLGCAASTRGGLHRVRCCCCCCRRRRGRCCRCCSSLSGWS